MEEKINVYRFNPIDSREKSMVEDINYHLRALLRSLIRCIRVESPDRPGVWVPMNIRRLCAQFGTSTTTYYAHIRKLAADLQPDGWWARLFRFIMERISDERLCRSFWTELGTVMLGALSFVHVLY
ncbi:MAG: hypothetical protein LBN06_04795 [Prevotellaceae bacterium]|jgi:hypothetical protein|nr:hypothetical protein [Prevotellaceae bacterium]